MYSKSYRSLNDLSSLWIGFQQVLKIESWTKAKKRKKTNIWLTVSYFAIFRIEISARIVGIVAFWWGPRNIHGVIPDLQLSNTRNIRGWNRNTQYYSDITWVTWCLKSPKTWFFLFNRSFRLTIKKTYWSFERESSSDWWIPLQGPVMQKVPPCDDIIMYQKYHDILWDPAGHLEPNSLMNQNFIKTWSMKKTLKFAWAMCALWWSGTVRC